MQVILVIVQRRCPGSKPELEDGLSSGSLVLSTVRPTVIVALTEHRHWVWIGWPMWQRSQGKRGLGDGVMDASLQRQDSGDGPWVGECLY